ncbi:MAG: class I SAM-dependent methyltransferase [Acidimicrobiia bacterium]
MRTNEPSRTARGVAAVRAHVERMPWPSGDAAADERLTVAVAGERSTERSEHPVHTVAELFRWVEARTRFFDEAVVQALERGIEQVVIVGAGYDGRALRYRTPGVRFFEVDHPATQADKRARLEDVAAAVDDVTFVAVDLTEPGLDERLAAAGHDADRPSLFAMEGLLRYLPERWVLDLLAVTARRGAPGSTLVVSISTREEAPSESERAGEARLAAAGEAVLTVPTRETALSWLAGAGWVVSSVREADRPEQRKGLLVAAHRG